MRLIPYTIAITLAATQAACSLLLDPKQCATDDECRMKGSAFAATVCRAGVCLSPSGESDAGRDAGEPADQCTSTAECIAANGAHSVCLGVVGRRCATLTSKDCATVMGDDTRDNPLLVGWLVDTKQSDSEDEMAGAALARNDFQQALAGVPATQGMAPQPLVLVVCAEQDDPLRAARHLAEGLKVPAIIGPSSSARLLEVASQVTTKSGTLLVSPSASSHQISKLSDQNLVFRTAPSDALEGKVMGLVASRLGTGSARAVAVSTASDRGEGLTIGLEGSLSLNGRSLADNTKSGTYVALSLGSSPDADALALVAGEAVAARPTLVLLAGDAELSPLIAAIEAAWPREAASPEPPSYVVAATVASASLLKALGSAPVERLSRIHVVFPDNGRSAVFQTFRRLFASGTAKTPRFFEAAKAYDAVYVVGLSVIPGLGERGAQSVTGSEMAEAIPAFLVRGDRVEAGAIPLAGVAARLSVRSVVDLVGASGPLDFNGDGDVDTNMEVGCLTRSTGGLVSLTTSEAYYRAGTSAAAGALIGALGPCP